MSTLKNLQGATGRPDPSVQGVWEVRTKDGVRAIVYLAGYREPMGNVRATNDFEVDDRHMGAEKTAEPARHIHRFQHGDTCICGAKRCASVSDATRLRCTKAATENGLCAAHQHKAHGMHASLKLTAKFLQAAATDWSKPHCENCGRQNPQRDDGYTTCCNELMCSGINPNQPFFRGYRFGNEKVNVRACCWAHATEIFEKKGIKIPEDASKLFDR
jgi:hypothetical protein